MSRPMGGITYRGKKLEYIQKDALSHILAKMCRWGLTVRDIEKALQKMEGDANGKK